jgi:formate dehydrogenase assembly factor FdhD
MRGANTKFGDTGGVHASGLFDFSGTLLNVSEDVASFELVQKAIRAGVSVRRETAHRRVSRSILQ